MVTQRVVQTSEDMRGLRGFFIEFLLQPLIQQRLDLHAPLCLICVSPRRGRLTIAHRFIGGIKFEYETAVREADG